MFGRCWSIQKNKRFPRIATCYCNSGKIFLEFLRKTDGTAGNTLDIMINPQVIHLFLGERVGMSLAHGDSILSVSLIGYSLPQNSPV